MTRPPYEIPEAEWEKLSRREKIDSWRTWMKILEASRSRVLLNDPFAGAKLATLRDSLDAAVQAIRDLIAADSDGA